MGSIPLLTICIPTYNRAQHVQKLLVYLTGTILPLGNDDIEVIVVNNCSKDDTKKILDEVRHPAFRIYHRENFLKTAEENIIHSLEYCRGEYVWFLGDDDVPVQATFKACLEKLRSNSADYYLFNPALVDKEGNLYTPQTMRMNRDEITGTTVDLVLSVGCLFTFAGISNHVIRRNLLSFDRGKHYLATSLIYSMVAWTIEAGSQSRAVLVNRPLVYYRENDYGNGHWERTAENMNVGDQYFWSLGLVELFDQLVQSGCISHYQIGLIFDVNRDGGRYRLIDEMLFKHFLQIEKGWKTKKARQKLTVDQMQKFATFCMRADPLTFDLLKLLEQMNMQSIRWRALSLSVLALWRYKKKFHQMFNQRQTLGQWAARVEQIHCGYEILWTPLQYVAIRGGDKVLRDRVMKYLDPLPEPPSVFVDTDREELLRKIYHFTSDSAYFAKLSESGHFSKASFERASLALQKLKDVHLSRSWRLTAPLRAVKTHFRRLVGHQ